MSWAHLSLPFLFPCPFLLPFPPPPHPHWLSVNYESAGAALRKCCWVPIAWEFSPRSQFWRPPQAQESKWWVTPILSDSCLLLAWIRSTHTAKIRLGPDWWLQIHYFFQENPDTLIWALDAMLWAINSQLCKVGTVTPIYQKRKETKLLIQGHRNQSPPNYKDSPRQTLAG